MTTEKKFPKRSTCRHCGRPIVFKKHPDHESDRAMWFWSKDSWVDAKVVEFEGEAEEYERQFRIAKWNRECSLKYGESSVEHAPDNICWFTTGGGDPCVTALRTVETDEDGEPIHACGRHLKRAVALSVSRRENRQKDALRKYENQAKWEVLTWLRSKGLIVRGSLDYGEYGQVHIPTLMRVIGDFEAQIMFLNGEGGEDVTFENEASNDPL